MGRGKIFNTLVEIPRHKKVSLVLVLSWLLVGALSCGSETPTEPSRKSPAPVTQEQTPAPQAGSIEKEQTSTTAAPTGQMVSESGVGQGSLNAVEVSPLDIKSVGFSPERPIAGDRIKAQVVFEKPEYSSTPLHYRWKINEEIVQESDEDVLQHPVKRGDLVELSVFVGNQRRESRSKTATVTVANAPPVAKQVEEHLDSSRQYTARFETSDPDGDMVALKLQRGPSGMVLDPSTKELRWSVPEGTSGSFPIEVLVSDPVGASAIFSYTITLREVQQPTVGSSANATSTSSPSQ